MKHGDSQKSTNEQLSPLGKTTQQRKSPHPPAAKGARAACHHFASPLCPIDDVQVIGAQIRSSCSCRESRLGETRSYMFFFEIVVFSNLFFLAIIGEASCGLASSGALTLIIGGGFFYGQIPKLRRPRGRPRCLHRAQMLSAVCLALDLVCRAHLWLSERQRAWLQVSEQWHRCSCQNVQAKGE